MKRSGDRFEYFKNGRLWYWHLVVAHSPSPTPAAVCGRSYRSKREVLAAIKKTKLAAKGATDEPILVSAPMSSIAHR